MEWVETNRGNNNHKTKRNKTKQNKADKEDHREGILQQEEI